MSVNALIAQGVRPLGDELIGVQQTVNRNALANREMANREAGLGLDQQRYTDQQQRLDRMDQAAAGEAQQLDVKRTVQGAINFVNSNPESLGSVIGELQSKGIIQGVQPQGMSIQAVNEWAAKNGFEVPQAAVPFEQGDKAAELRLRAELEQGAAARTHQHRLAEIAAQGANRPGAVGGAPDDGLNDRQRAAVVMQRQAGITYAASLTGKKPEEIARLLDEKGPQAVADLMNKEGKRFLQGGFARFIQGVPGGQALLDISNADLKAPTSAGGAGIAMFQNPSGPITGADFEAGRMQMPNPTYPLKTQSEIIRQMLSTGGNQTPSQVREFATEAEAEASGVKGEVTIGGRRARID